MVGGLHFAAEISFVVFYYSSEKCFGCFGVQHNTTNCFLSEVISREKHQPLVDSLPEWLTLC
jgi:hypothetical protein